MAEPIHCPHAKSDMTPCYIRDHELAIFEKDQPLVAYCVGCERRVYPTNSQWSRYAELSKAAARKNKKRR